MGLYQLRLRPRRGLWPRLRPGSVEFSAVVARGGRGAALRRCDQGDRDADRHAETEAKQNLNADELKAWKQRTTDGKQLFARPRKGGNLALAISEEKDFTTSRTPWSCFSRADFQNRFLPTSERPKLWIPP